MFYGKRSLHSHSKRTKISRAVVEKAITSTPFFRSEIVDPDRLEGAREILRDMGLCIVANHFSRKETVQMFQIPFRDSEMRKREIVAPVAVHQKLFFMDPLSHLLGVSLRYIATEETLRRAHEKRKPSPAENEGAREFMNDALEVLSKGGIVIIFPQATRRETLYSPDNRNPKTIFTLMNQAKKSNVQLGFLFVGVDLAEEVEDYSKVRGFNALKKYMLTIGNSLTDAELLVQAGGKLGEVDKIVYKQLESLVSPGYVSTS